jgi:hypothetical protein
MHCGGFRNRSPETKYTLAKMVALAVNGITSLSVRPIRMIAPKGIVLFVVFLSTSVRVFGTWLAGQTVQGWTSVMLLFLLIASFQTFAIAVIGEYVGKIYFETKARPRYIVEEEIGIIPAMPRNCAQSHRDDTGFAKWLFACERVIGYCTGARSWKARSNKSR